MLVVNQNSYVDTDYADSYFTDRLFADAWSNATQTQKEQALVMATRAIDRQILVGAKKLDDQPLQFPRRYPFRIHDIWRKWFQFNITDQWETLYVEGASWWADVDVPEIVKQAECEEALALLERGGDSRTKLQKAGVRRFTFSRSTAEEYAPGSGKGLLSVEAREILRLWLAGSVQMT
jgi:hypothetical protein